MKKTLKIVCIYNPFESTIDREEKIVSFDGFKTIEECIREYYKEVSLIDNVQSCYNGHFVDRSFKIQSGGILTFTINPGNDNQSLRMIAAAVITVAAVVTGNVYGAQLGVS